MNQNNYINLPLATLVSASLLIGCGGSGSKDDLENYPSVRVTSIEMSGVLNVEEGHRVQLTSDYSDPDGAVVKTIWQQLTGIGVEVTQLGGGMATFLAPQVEQTETLYFSLTVTDDDGNNTKTHLTVKVHDSSSDDQVTPDTKQYDGFAVTNTTATFKSDYNQHCINQLGQEWQLAEWQDLVNYASQTTDLMAWVTALGLDQEQSVFVSFNGNTQYTSERDYFITYHDHNKPDHYLAHQNIDDYFLSLGSWSGDRAVLCKINKAPDINDDFEHLTVARVESTATQLRSSARQAHIVHEDGFSKQDGSLDIGRVILSRLDGGTFSNDIGFSFDMKFAGSGQQYQDGAAILYLDTDLNPNTGYPINGIGADMRLAETGSVNPQTTGLSEWDLGRWSPIMGRSSGSADHLVEVTGGAHFHVGVYGSSHLLYSAAHGVLAVEQLTGSGTRYDSTRAFDIEGF